MGKITVLGLGPSIHEFNPVEFELSVGVNDIWKFIKSDVIVCLDNPSIFTPERLKIINESKPEAFYSQMVAWDERPDFKKINILPSYPDTYLNLDANEFYKSYCSPFVAVQVGYKYYGATEIHLYGVDLLNHPHLNEVYCTKIKKHFVVLKSALETKGVELIVHGNGILKDL
jgi:hypothetical protein